MIPFKFFFRYNESFYLYFRYITWKDKMLMWVGGFSAIACGALLPSLSIIFGTLTNTFDPSNGSDDILHSMKRLSGIISLVGLSCWICGYLYYAFW